MYKQGETVTIMIYSDDYRKKGKRRELVKQKWEVVKQYKHFIRCKRRLRSGCMITECFAIEDIEKGVIE